MTPTPTAPTLLTKLITTSAGTTHFDLTFSTTMSKGGGSIFVTDGAIQTVINRVTGQPELRVVGATVTREIALGEVAISGAHVVFDTSGLAPGGAYNVFLGAGTLLGGGRAFAGITAPGQLAFTTPQVTAPAGLEADIMIEDRTLRAGEDLTVTITFSEAVAQLDPGAIHAEHASIKGLASSNDGLTWSFVLAADDSVDSPSNLLRLDLSQVAAASGLHGSGMLASRPYAVDTIVDAWLAPQIGVSDTGPFDDDGITAAATQSVSGFVSGSLAPDEHIELTINGREIDVALIRLTPAGDGWRWSYDARDETGEAPAFDEGADNTIVARIVNQDGHGSATVVQRVTLDTSAPRITGSPHGETDLAVDADIVITFDEAVYWHAEPGNAGILYLHGDDDSTIEVQLSADDFSDNGHRLTIKPAAHKLQADVGYSLRLPENLSDFAGNPLGGYDMAFHTVGGPSALQAYVDGDGSYRAGETLTFRLRFDEAIGTVGLVMPSLRLSNGKDAQFAAIDGNEISFRYTVADGDDARGLAIDAGTGLAGKVRDLAGNLLDAQHIVFSGIYDQAGGGILGIDIDTTIATPPAPLLASASNSGSLLDHITNDRTPTLAGTAEAHALVEIYAGAVLAGSGYADADGNWEASVEPVHALADGVHSLTVQQVDRAGNRSGASGTLALTIDTNAPGALAGVSLATDTGVSGNDRITRESFAALRGSGAEAHAEITIMDGDSVVGSGTSDAGGNWLVFFQDELPDGVHTVSVHQRDKAGNLGAASAPLTFTVDTEGPASAPPAPMLAVASDTGTLGDRITSDTTPTFTGSGAMASTIVGLYIDASAAGTAMTDALGNWTIDTVGNGGGLADGNYSVTVKQFDLAGNPSEASAVFNLVVDTAVPTAALTLDLVSASDRGVSSSDNLTNLATPTFSGAGARPESQIALVVGDMEVGRVVAGADGNWSVTIAANKALLDGTHMVRARQLDAGGNPGAESDPLALTIDTVRPELTDFHNDRSLKQFELTFDEEVFFRPGGVFKLMQGTTERRVFNGNDSGNWQITTDNDGDALLILKIGMNGTFKLQMDHNDAVQDLAGNVAEIVGSPIWDVINDL